MQKHLLIRRGYAILVKTEFYLHILSEDKFYMTRKEAREQAFIFLFERLFSPELSYDELCELAAQCRFLEADDYTRVLFEKTAENTEKADEVINRLSKGWKTTRLSRVTLCLLRMALTEILLIEETPDSVAVNEAVELAKTYATVDDAQFINGILGTAVREKTGV